MERQIDAGNGHSIFFQMYPSHNLVAHTCNLLGLGLGGIGAKRYHLRENPQAIDSVRFGGNPQQDFFSYPIKKLALEHISDVNNAIEKVKRKEKELDRLPTVSQMFQTSWNEFYRKYWEDNCSRLEQKFSAMLSSKDWASTLKTMSTLTGGKMLFDFYVVGTEATAGSATMIEPNISIGTIQRNGNCGFIHEGFHLLINSVKFDYSSAYSFANSHPWTKEHSKKFPYPNWSEKIEQAVVITLDSLVSNTPEYLNGCRVGDLKEAIYFPLVEWHTTNNKTPLPKFLEQLLRKNEKEIFKN
jgi:hypothetical protein